ncbi:MAG: amidohydrolase family protein [Acidobacteriota bacterium]
MKSPVIDFHIHIQPWEMMKPAVLATMRRNRPSFDDLLALSKDPQKFLRKLDDCGIERAGIINYVSPDLIGFTDEINAFSAGFCREDPDRLLAFGSIDPRRSRDPAGEVERLLEKGIRALKLHPPHQGVTPHGYRDDAGGRGPFPALEGFYAQAQRLGMPVMIHTGTSVFPGARSRLGDPIGIDDVAVDFPDLTLLLAHSGRPLWSQTCFFLARRHAHVHLELSGIPPHRLLHALPRLEKLAHKAIFGTDWPGPGVPDPERNIAAFNRLPLGAEARQAMLYDNARAIWDRLPGL